MPAGTTGPSNLRLLSLTNTEVTLGWEGGGVLQESLTLSGWADLPGITSGEAFPRVGPLHFYRVRP